MRPRVVPARSGETKMPLCAGRRRPLGSSGVRPGNSDGLERAQRRSFAGCTEHASRERTGAGSQGGTVPGYDRSRRYPPRGVWFGLFLAAMSLRAAAAQDVLDEATRRQLNDPVTLAAERVTHWIGPDGHWVHLWGNVSVLHGSLPVVRAREAVVRISDESTEFEKIKLVEVYAEGITRPAREDSPQQRAGRASLRTSELRLTRFGGSVSEAKTPPWQLQIIKRSGLREKKPARPVPARRDRDQDSSSIDSHLDALIRRPVTKPGPSAGARASVAVIPTQAIVRNQSDDPAPPLVSSPPVKPGPPAANARSQPVWGTQARRDGTAGRGGLGWPINWCDAGRAGCGANGRPASAADGDAASAADQHAAAHHRPASD